MIVRNGNVFIDRKIKKLDLRIENRVITEIAENIEGEGIDVNNRLVTPCFWDLHTHLRAPGLDYKEEPEETIKKAIKGGYNLINTMPNTEPAIDNEVTVDYINHLLRPACFEILVTGAITRKREGRELSEIEFMADKGIVAISDDGIWTQDSFLTYQALRYAEKHNLLMFIHPQDQSLFTRGRIYEGRASFRTGLKGFPKEAEAIAILRDGILAEEIKVRLHFTHISTSKGLEAMSYLKSRGVKFTCDITPHHLIFTEDVYENYDTNYKANPPFGTEKDRKALLQAVNNEEVNSIATDHAPHAPHEKSVEWEDAPYGIASIDTAFEAMNSQLVETGLISLERLLFLLTEGPAIILGRENKIALGMPANINIINLNAPHTILTFGKARNNPYVGLQSNVQMEKVILNGNLQFLS